MKNKIKLRKIKCSICGTDMMRTRVFSTVDVRGSKSFGDIMELARKEDEEVEGVEITYKCPDCGFSASMIFGVEYDTEAENGEA